MTEAHLARQDQDKFHSRADAVFGALNNPSAAAPAWSLSKQLVVRAGRAEAYSSDEEQEAEANEQARQEVTGDGLAKFQGSLQAVAEDSVRGSEGTVFIQYTCWRLSTNLRPQLALCSQSRPTALAAVQIPY